MKNTNLKVTALVREPWPATDPFLLCVHHVDHYPTSDGNMGVPSEELKTRRAKPSIDSQTGFDMYFGTRVPGFPMHPHRGFETITYVRSGYIDHADSLGSTARYGKGDVQWLTAGHGVQHSEMFPVLDEEPDNKHELFQIWFNLPARSKMVEPEFKMFWAEELPVWRSQESGKQDQDVVNEVTVLAGVFQTPQGATLVPPAPPKSSWAAVNENKVAIWVIKLSAGQRLTLPPERSGGDLSRTLYVFSADKFHINGASHAGKSLIDVDPAVAVELENLGSDLLEILLMQGRPIGEPVVSQGPFVMNTEQEAYQARVDYSKTQFGGWPWPDSGPVHPLDSGRFARYAGSDKDVRPVQIDPGPNNS